jgi:hypothetical protein
LAHVQLCYRVGLAWIGSLGLKKISKLVTEDFQPLKGAPGGFPYWVDVEGHEIRGDESDPVAAARLLEGLVFGELGLSDLSDRVSLSPPGSSSLDWILATDLWVGERSSVFVGRSEGSRHVFFVAARVDSREANKFARAEVLDPPARGVVGVSFHGPGQVICLGNTASSQISTTVNFAPRGAELSKQLIAPLEALDPVTGSWTKISTLRVAPTMAFDAALAPNEWKAFRISV